ncbi:MAG: hypothetical protein AB7D38_02300 [Sulfurimonas sp.]|uniref:hypothetical protein n=1 Tax=Sulfurimonas sp. TaxID=2022749 RepID=UPI003D09E6FB
MNIIQGTLSIDAKADNKTLHTFSKEILIHLQDIKEIHVDDSLGFESSTLFDMLASIRISAPNIKISFFDTDALKTKKIGLVSLDVRG